MQITHRAAPDGRDAGDKGKARDVQPRTPCHKGTRMRKNKNRRIVKKGKHRLVSRRCRFEKADRVAFDLLPFGLVTPNIRQTRDAMPLQTPMPHRPGQVAVCLTRPVLAPKVHRSCSAPQGRHPDTGKVMGMNKYAGALFYLADRIHFVEYETLDFKSITQVTLYPSHQHRLLRLMGIQTGGPTRRGRKPGASKVALDYLGKDINPQGLGRDRFVRARFWAFAQ